MIKTDLEESKLVWCLMRTDNKCLNVPYVNITACDGEGWVSRDQLLEREAVDTRLGRDEETR